MICKKCQTTFKEKRWDQIYCSSPCRLTAQRDKIIEGFRIKREAKQKQRAEEEKQNAEQIAEAIKNKAPESLIANAKQVIDGNTPIEKNLEAILYGATQYFMPFCCLASYGFKPSWFHREIGRALEKVEKGEIKRLIISMPPRHGKTTLSTILFPCWFLGRNPNKEIITVSYSAELANEFGEKSRDILRSAKYQAIFQTRLKADSESKQRWKTDAGGAYTSTGLGGAITGRGANVLIIDDPIKNQEEALSETYRQKVWNYYTSTLYTRLEKDAPVILILTRWHEDDLAGRLIEAAKHGGDQWTVIKYPAIAEENESHRKSGDPLWPEKYPLEVLSNIKNTIGVYDWASLYQQNPRSQESQEFKKEYFRYFEEADILTRTLDVYVMVDLAISQKSIADNTSIQVIGKEKTKPEIYHLEEYTGKFDPLQVIDILFTLKAKYGIKLIRIGIESVGYQKALQFFITEEMKRRGIYFEIVELKAEGNKESRIRGLLPMYKSGVILHRHSDTALENELLLFPVGKHDDRIDALQYLQQIVKNTTSTQGASVYYPHLKKIKSPFKFL